MTPNDKNYVDRLHNQQVNELNEIKNRLLILEGKTTATTDGNIRVEIDTDKIYEMFLKACHDCLQQRQERHQEEDRQAEERLRQECEAKGEPYYATEKEICIATLKEFNTFYRLIITYIKRTETKFNNIHSDVLKHLGASTPTNETSKHHSLFYNYSLPSSFKTKVTELRHRLFQRIRAYLTGSFSLHRGWTILTVLLYLVFLIALLSFRLIISFLG